MSLFLLCPLPAGQVELHDARRQRRWTVHLEPFEIAAVPITVGQYAQYVPSTADTELEPRAAMAGLSWLDSVRFCNTVSERAGLTPAYTFADDDVT
ncbi:MAG: formylglycine-generating enzyme family protein, partial [Canibacter sp.]